MKIKNNNGITLIALVITIIVLLILAGVSINALVGDNGIISQTQRAKIATKFASYKEEMELNIVGEYDDKGNLSKSIIALNDNIKQYIKSIEDNDIGQFGIVGGKLYYLGDNKEYKSIAKAQGLEIIGEDENIEDYISRVENLALENIIKDMAGKKFFETSEDGTNKELGIKLYDKNLVNGNKWKIITEISEGKTVATYGTGWYYIEKGKTIDKIGTLKNDYIINYDTQKAVKFDAKKHTMLAYGANLAVKDNLICNIDPILIENSENMTDDMIIQSFGKGIEIKGYDNIKNSFSKTEFKFDGIDDHFNIKYDSEEDKNKLIENGFTFELYGKFQDGKSYNGALQEYNTPYTGFFGYWNGNEKNQCVLRFGLLSKSIYWNSGYGGSHGDGTDYIRKGAEWNIEYPPILDYDVNKSMYITITLDTKNEYLINDQIYYKHKLYINGKLFCEGNYNKDRWDLFKENMKNLNTFTIGRCSQEGDGWWHYTKMDAYSLRLYSKGLSDDEVLANYNATTSFHNILVNGGNAESGGNTGGENLDNIE